MDEKIESLLMQILEGQNETNNRLDGTNSKLDRIEKKLDAVVSQTADLTEFRTMALDKLTTISNNVDKIKNDLNTVEIVTSKKLERDSPTKSS